MPYSYNLSHEAEDDILEAYVWYEQQKTGLGEELLESLDKARQSILQNPATYRIRYKKKVRAFLVDRFSISHYVCGTKEWREYCFSVQHEP